MTKRQYVKFTFIFLGILISIIIFFGASLVFKIIKDMVWPGTEEGVAKIEQYLDDRKLERISEEGEDPFGEDEIVRVLLIGLDNRVGEESGNCDAIQLFEIDRKNSTVIITAVPRGTYSSLPSGKGVTSSDYYVSNACGLGGLEYGIKQIERILGKKVDYVAVVGFSETLGIFRYLKLPTTETLQWLRHRQGYAVGEPQRARNHSTFLKQLLIKYIPGADSELNSTWQFLLYKLVKTDLSFGQVKQITDTLATMNLSANPERINLAMRPAYEVQDIIYDPNTVNKYVESMINPIKILLNSEDYSDDSDETVQRKLLDTFENELDNDEFIKWAFDNSLWLQISDEEMRLEMQWEITIRYISQLSNEEEKEKMFTDYVLEMEYLGSKEWAERGRRVIRGRFLILDL